MSQSPNPKLPDNYNYTGLRDRLHPQLRAKVAHAFLEIVYMHGDVLLGADQNQRLFSEQTSKIFAGMDPDNPPDTLYADTPDGSGPGSVAWDEGTKFIESVLDPENNKPEDPEEW